MGSNIELAKFGGENAITNNYSECHAGKEMNHVLLYTDGVKYFALLAMHAPSECRNDYQSQQQRQYVSTKGENKTQNFSGRTICFKVPLKQKVQGCISIIT